MKQQKNAGRRSSQIYGRNPYYSADSSARQVYVDESLEPKKIPQKKYKKVNVRYDRSLVNDIQEKIRHHFLSYMLVLAFFGGIIGVLALNARLDQAVAGREAASHELAVISASNMARRGEMEAGIDSAALEYYAIHSLGMVRAEDFQRVEVSIPRQAYVTDISETTSSGFSFARLWDSIFSVTASN